MTGIIQHPIRNQPAGLPSGVQGLQIFKEGQLPQIPYRKRKKPKRRVSVSLA